MCIKTNINLYRIFDSTHIARMVLNAYQVLLVQYYIKYIFNGKIPT